jgi:hypothetical protein
LLVNFDSNLSLADLFCDFFLHCVGKIAAHIVCCRFRSRIGIIAIIIDVVVVLSFAIHGGFHLHGVFD